MLQTTRLQLGNVSCKPGLKGVGENLCKKGWRFGGGGAITPGILPSAPSGSRFAGSNRSKLGFPCLAKNSGFAFIANPSLAMRWTPGDLSNPRRTYALARFQDRPAHAPVLNPLGHTAEFGGEGEIRTHERLTPLAVFKTAALNHSATSPNDARLHPDPAAGFQAARRMRLALTHSAIPPVGRII